MTATTVVDHSSKRKSIKDIFGGRGIIVPLYPLLAEHIGDGDALLLVQIEYWIDHLRVKVEEFEGVKWLNLSAQQMIERGFRHLDRRNINRTITRLVERGLLRVAYLPGSATKWLTLDYDMLERLDADANPGAQAVPSQGETPQPQQIEQIRGEMPQSGTNRPGQDERNAPDSEANRPAPPLYIKDPRDHLTTDKEREVEAAQLQTDAPAIEPPTASPPKQMIPNAENKIEEKTPPDSAAPEPPQTAEAIPLEKTLEDMMDALETACAMDRNLNWQARQIENYAKLLLNAGYTSRDVDWHCDWWYKHDWRGKKDEVPRLKELADTLHLSRPAVYKDFRGVAQIPSNRNRARLHQKADPSCECCSGDGWLPSYDPRAAWSLCDCVDRKGIVIST